MQDLKHKILLALIAATIVGEVVSIILWTTNRPVAGEPSARFTLVVDYIYAVANAAVLAALNLVAFIWIMKRNRIGSLFLIAVSIINRLLSQFIFEGGMHLIFVTWTALLVIFSYMEYRGLSNRETFFLSGGVIIDLAASSLIFNPVNTAFFGVIFYFVFIALLVGTLIATKTAVVLGIIKEN